MDSAVTQIIQAFLDSVGNAAGAENAELPNWTKEVDGLKFGLDSKNIYIAGLKIPAAVLALLPVPAATNQQNAFKRDGIIYDDLRRAVQRAQTMDDFKEAIRKLREQRQRGVDFERAQRTRILAGGRTQSRNWSTPKRRISWGRGPTSGPRNDPLSVSVMAGDRRGDGQAFCRAGWGCVVPGPDLLHSIPPSRSAAQQLS